MFLAGIVSVLAAFGGYLNAGGGEELLRTALAKFISGKISFDPVKLKWKEGELEVTRLSYDKQIEWPADKPIVKCSGISANQVNVQLDLLPWPPKVQAITVHGMPDLTINLSEGFLQSGKLQELKTETIPPLQFVDCNLNLTIGSIGPLLLTGCSGELRHGTAGEPRGAFSLRALNGKPFNFKLETMEDGRWVFSCDENIIDTNETLKTKNIPFMDRMDLVSMLVRALFTGELGAKGTVSSLRVSVQPATDRRKFICDGEVGYRNLEFNLPKPELPTGQALPGFLDRLLGTKETFWPRGMQVDSIRTGSSGRVTFHMEDGKLDFACDEGAGSAFTGIKDGKTFPPLEALKGSVETDKDDKPARIVLRGFLGDQLSFETRMDRQADNSRVYEMILEPRAGDSQKIVFGKPLWRFASKVQDFLDATQLPPPDEIGLRPLVAFELESDARHFPWPEFLPPGMRDLSGHLYAKGRYTDGMRLRLEKIVLDDHSSMIYGGSPDASVQSSTSDFGPLWAAVESLFGTNTPWKLQDISVEGKAEVVFGVDLSAKTMRWETTVMKNFTLNSGIISHAGLTSDVGVAAPVITATHKRLSDQSEITVTAAVPGLWDLKLIGSWKCEPGKACSGEFTLIERDVPLALHPQRAVLSGDYISADKRRVNRSTTIRIVDGKIQRDVK